MKNEISFSLKYLMNVSGKTEPKKDSFAEDMTLYREMNFITMPLQKINYRI